MATEFPGHGCMADLTTERKRRWLLMCLAYCFDMLSMGVCIKQALADVRSTGAGINCLYCRLNYFIKVTERGV